MQHLNSGSDNALQRIQQLGYDSAWFQGAITSGEVTHVQLADRPTRSLEQLGRKCLHFTWKSRGTVSLAGLDLQVSTACTAQSLHTVAYGSRHDSQTQLLH